MNLTKETQGELLVFVEVVIWSLFPVITILSYGTLTPLYTAVFSVALSSVFFSVVLTVRKKWHELLVREAWFDILMVTLIIGVVYYTLAFVGINHTSAGNASIVALMEVFFSFAIFRSWKGERLGFKQNTGAFLMVLGAAIILFPKHTHPGIGDLLILLAAAIAPFGNHFSQSARKKVGSVTIMFIRSVLSIFFLLLMAYFFEPMPGREVLIASFGFLIINGIAILGISKLLWIEAIHRIPVTKAISLASIAPAFTLLFAYFFLKDVPTYSQILGFLPILAGIILLTNKTHGKTQT
jgi:drug/metabolite transporter (DMT)-like permease